VAAPLLVVALVGGCGASGNSAAQAHINAQFSATLNQICASGNQELARIGKPVNAAAFVRILELTLSDTAAQLRQYTALKPPSGLRARFDRYVSISKQQQRIMTTMARDANSDMFAQVFALNTRLTTLNGPNNTVAKQLGAPACATTAGQTTTQTTPAPAAAA
jgi:hypothetical protein